MMNAEQRVELEVLITNLMSGTCAGQPATGEQQAHRVISIIEIVKGPR